MVDAYDEFAQLADNAAEVGLPWNGPPSVSRRVVELFDGRRMSALVWGEGGAEVVLLHGGSQNAHTWDTVALALGRPLAAVDLPGHGHSGWRPDHDYTVDNMADDVAAVIRRLAPKLRLVVGMSLGGLTALALSERYPDLVPRLLLVDVTPGVNAEKSKAITDFVRGPERFADFDEILERTIQHHPGRSESSLRRGVRHNAMPDPDGGWTWRWDPHRPAGEADPAATFRGLWDAVDSLRAPLLLVRASASAVVDDDDEAEVRHRKPDARIEVVEGAGHSIQGDRPLELASLIAAELRAADPDAGPPAGH